MNDASLKCVFLFCSCTQPKAVNVTFCAFSFESTPRPPAPSPNPFLFPLLAPYLSTSKLLGITAYDHTVFYSTQKHNCFCLPVYLDFQVYHCFCIFFPPKLPPQARFQYFLRQTRRFAKKNSCFDLSYLLLMCFRLLRRSTRSSAASAGSGIIGHSGHDFVTFHASLVTLCRCRTSVDSCVLVHVPREGLQAGCVEFRHFSNL